MKLLFTLAILPVMLCSFVCKAQSTNFSAYFNSKNNIVTLNWNMITNSGKTWYVILRSADGISWTEAAKDKVLRNYTEDDFYSFEDKFYTVGKNFYRIKISDSYNNTVALSPVVTVNTFATKGEITGTWVIYPNPVGDILTLKYNGTAEIKGVVNIQILDETGKVFMKYRSASIYKTIEIPLNSMNKIKRGIYTIQVTVMNEMVMNKQFIKQ